MPAEGGGYRKWTYAVGTLLPGERGGHTEFGMTRYQSAGSPADCILSVKAGGTTLQYAGWGPLFASSREAAPVVHFGGPVVTRPLRGAAFPLAPGVRELSFCVGTPGVGERSFA